MTQKRNSFFLAALSVLSALLSACRPSTDTTPPTVTLSGPASVTGQGSASTTITAQASDASGISSVRFYDGTTLLGTDTSAPYEQSVTFAPADSGNHVIKAVATDPSGNQGAATLSINVNVSAAGGGGGGGSGGGGTVPDVKLNGTVYEMNIGVDPVTMQPSITRRNWTQGAQQVQFQVGVGANKVKVNTGNVSETGALDIGIPGSVANLLTPAQVFTPVSSTDVTVTCNGAPQSSDPQARLNAGVILYSAQTSVNPAESLAWLDSVTITQLTRLAGMTLVYADRPTSLSSKMNCAVSAKNLPGPQTMYYTFNVNLQKGWNFVASDFSGEVTSGIFNIDLRSGTSPGAWFILTRLP